MESKVPSTGDSSDGHRSLSLPAYQTRVLITDEHLANLLGSPHLGALAHVRLVHQRA
jgi:hypothetical protein